MKFLAKDIHHGPTDAIQSLGGDGFATAQQNQLPGLTHGFTRCLKFL